MPIYGGPSQQGYCQRCGFQKIRSTLREDGRLKNLLVCSACWDPDHPLDYPAPPRSEGMPPLKPSLLDIPITAPVLDAEIDEELAITVSWTAATSNADRIDGYMLYRMVGDGDFALIATLENEYSSWGELTSETLVFEDESVFANGSEIAYYVVAYTASGASVNSNTDTITFLFAPTLEVTGATASTFNLSWLGALSACEITGFELYYKREGETEFTLYDTYAPDVFDVDISFLYADSDFYVVVLDACDNETQSNTVHVGDYLTMNVEILLFTNGNTVRNSEDAGSTWGSFTAGGTGLSTSGQKSVAWSRELGVAVYLSASVQVPHYSLDRGRTWTKCSFPDGEPDPNGLARPYYVAWHPGFQKFVAFADAPNTAGMPMAYISDDGISFSEAGSSPGVSGTNLPGDPGIGTLNAAFLTEDAVYSAHNWGNPGGIMSSTDLVNWSRSPYYSSLNPASRDISTYSPELDIAIAADNNATMKKSVGPAHDAWVSIAGTLGTNKAVWVSSLGMFVACGNGFALYSTDGDNWSVGSTPGSESNIGNSHMIWVPELNAGFSCGSPPGPTHNICKSTDGINWSLSLPSSGTSSGAAKLLACTYYTFEGI
jgi:hypothetical protein